MSFKFTTAGFLLVLIGFIGVIKYFVNQGTLQTNDILIAVFNLCFFISVGLVLNKGYRWTKYLVLVLAILGLINFPTVNMYSNISIIISLTYIVQRLLLIVAVILLFKAIKAKAA